MAKGKTKERQEFTKKTGFFEGKVVAINPTKEKLAKLLDTELEGEEISYVSTEEVDGISVQRSTIVFWIKNVKDEKYIRPIYFFLKDLERKNVVTDEEEKAGTKVRKLQYINNMGITSWSDNPLNLFDWFTERPYRVAKVGEEELYNFISAWLNKIDRKDPDAAILADFKKLIKGDVSELSVEINGEYDGTVMPLVVIREVEKDGEKKEYEQLYNGNMLPGFAISKLNGILDEDFIKKAKLTERKKRSHLQRFALEVSDPQYGIKDHYVLGPLQDYDPTKNPKVTGKVLTEDDTDY